MGRTPCCSKEGLNKGAWTALEDRILTAYIKAHGEGQWRSLPKRAGLKRCGKSCRLRWFNYLRPDIKRGNITKDEEELIIKLHKLLGNRWSLIAGRLPGRTDNEIKNYWNTILKKRANSSHASPLPPNKKSLQNNSNVQRETLPRNRSGSPCQSSIKPSVTATRPRVTRLKPARCSKVLGPVYPLPCHRDQVLVNTSGQEFDITMNHHQHQLEDNYANETSFFNFGSTHGQDLLHSETDNDGKVYSVHENIMAAIGESDRDSMVIDEPTMEDYWRIYTNCDAEVGGKDPLDLDLLAVFPHAD